MKHSKKFLEILAALRACEAHLDYIGWGDNWEREVSQDLRESLPDLLKKYDTVETPGFPISQKEVKK